MTKRSSSPGPLLDALWAEKICSAKGGRRDGKLTVTSRFVQSLTLYRETSGDDEKQN
jgi:hypothetical protein